MGEVSDELEQGALLLEYLTKDRRRVTRAGLNGGMANRLLLLLPEE
jgi:hypothetical protein